MGNILGAFNVESKGLFIFVTLDVPAVNVPAIKYVASEAKKVVNAKERKGKDSTLLYQWTFSDDQSTLCINEAYTSAKAFLNHLGNVGPILGKLTALAKITSLQAHGPAAEIAALKAAGLSIPISHFTIIDE